MSLSVFLFGDRFQLSLASTSTFIHQMVLYVDLLLLLGFSLFYRTLFALLYLAAFCEPSVLVVSTHAYYNWIGHVFCVCWFIHIQHSKCMILLKHSHFTWLMIEEPFSFVSSHRCALIFLLNLFQLFFCWTLCFAFIYIHLFNSNDSKQFFSFYAISRI